MKRSHMPTAIGMATISCLINILGFTSPLFMLQVYDRVLSSRSLSTLVSLSLLTLALLAVQAILEAVRGRIFIRLGEQLDHRFSASVHDAVLAVSLLPVKGKENLSPMRELDNLRNFVSGKGLTVPFDLPWLPVYIFVCYLLHPLIGTVALGGAALLVGTTVISALLTREPTYKTVTAMTARHNFLDSLRLGAETIVGMGFKHEMRRLWKTTDADFFAHNRKSADIANDLGQLAKGIRVALQSAVLAVGAYLVITERATGGVMIASSILLGKALSPLDLAVSHWKPFIVARQSWARLRDLERRQANRKDATALPRPQHQLKVETLTLGPFESRPIIRNLNFSVRAGSILGVLGRSGSGKSTLCRGLVGLWPPMTGHVRLDDAALEQWDETALGRDIGYLPQRVELLSGTIAQNISRFDPSANSHDIVAAAQSASVHELILRLEGGYETVIGERGQKLSAGQLQRIGLAQALYKDPFLVVLDEPNSNLDSDGEKAIVQALQNIKARNGIAVIVTHRPDALVAVDQLLVLEEGAQRNFGPRDKVLEALKYQGTSKFQTMGTARAAN